MSRKLEARPANERENRLSLLPILAQLDEQAVNDTPSPDLGPKSTFDWDDDEPRSGSIQISRKRTRDRELDRTESALAAVAAGESRASNDRQASSASPAAKSERRPLEGRGSLIAAPYPSMMTAARRPTASDRRASDIGNKSAEIVQVSL